MSDEVKNATDAEAATATATEQVEEPILDEHTTEPNTRPPVQRPTQQPAPGQWEMPKPKFQQTSGYLPQGYLKEMEAAGEAVKAAPEQAVSASPAAPVEGAPPAIEPQPDLTDQLIDDTPALDPAEKGTQAKSGPGLGMLVLGLIGILIFVAVFLTAVYFLFFAQPAGGNNF